MIFHGALFKLYFNNQRLNDFCQKLNIPLMGKLIIIAARGIL